MNFIFCPYCGSPYFVDSKRYTEITSFVIPENVYRICLTCGEKVSFEAPSKGVEEMVYSNAG